LLPKTPTGEPSIAAIERLTHALGACVGVSPLVRSRGRVAQDDADMAASGERFLVIQVASDPTATPPLGPSNQVAATPKVMPATLRTTIPTGFLKPWEFTRSREEAEYEANRAAAQGVLARFVQAMRRALARRGEYRRWRLLLNGRTIDEQLWVVRPPKGGTTDPAVRCWATASLGSAGYDAGVMLREWDIFWRRKEN
jgi:hypothetical protein